MNEAFNTTGFEQRVRDRAYALWESEGRPFGRDAEHWRMSEDGMRAEFAKPAFSKPAPANSAPAKPAPAKPAHSKKSARKRAASRH